MATDFEKADHKGSDYRCIYCGASSSERFPAEHVIPQQFGQFNVTIRCVCSECNRYFGQCLEWVLGRNTGEGILRIEHGLSEGRVGWNPETGVEIRYRELGPWFDCWLQMRANPQAPGCIAEVLPQIGARERELENWQWYREREINASIFEKHSTGHSIFKAVGQTPEIRARLINKLRALGFNLGNSKDESLRFVNEQGKVPVVVRYTFHDEISRCIAKISFNYLAYCEGPTFVLGKQFDRIRHYIRYGEELDMSKPGLVYIMNEPILTEERFGKRSTNGHLLRLRWENFDVLTCRVSLFNNIVYLVALCRGHQGIWFDISWGHLFDVESQTLSSLFASSGLML